MAIFFLNSQSQHNKNVFRDTSAPFLSLTASLCLVNLGKFPSAGKKKEFVEICYNW